MHYHDIVCLVFVAAAAGRVVLHRRGLAVRMIGGGSPRPAWGSAATTAVAAAAAAAFALPKRGDPSILGGPDAGVPALSDLEGTHIHRVELYVVLSLVANGPVREDVEPLGLQDTRALDVEFHDLGGSTEESIDRLVSRAVQLVHRVRVGIVPSGVRVDGLDVCLLVGEVQLGSFHSISTLFPPRASLIVGWQCSMGTPLLWTTMSTLFFDPLE